MTVFGGLRVPGELLAEEYALDLLSRYFRRDEQGYAYSGAMFDTYPADPAAAAPGPADMADVVTDSDLIALSMLGIRVTGHEALAITRYHTERIRELLGRIPASACIRSSTSAALLAQGGPAWDLWDLLRGIRDRTKDARLGAVAAGKLLARKRPALIPIEDSAIAEVFRRRAPDRDEGWWHDVRTAMQDDQPKANGVPLWEYLTGLRRSAHLDHLPVLRVLDIIAWMHARSAA